MKIISVIVENGVNIPSSPIPSTAIQVVCDGTNYTVYEAGDILPTPIVIAPNPNDAILAQIDTLEATQTPRRMREALTDPTWLNALNAQIAALRETLTT